MISKAYTATRLAVFASLCLFLIRPAVLSAPTHPLDTGWMFRFVGADSTASFATQPCTSGQWQKVTIPHSFNLQEEFDYHKYGFGWYRTKFPPIVKSVSDSVFLCFEGICLYAKVFVNSKLAGESLFPWLPFRINISNYTDGRDSISIAVQIDNRLREKDIPDLAARGWWTYGGIIRPVYLETMEKNRVENWQLRTLYKSSGTYLLQIGFDTVGPAPDKIEVEIRTNKNALFSHDIIAAEASPKANYEIVCKNVMPWSPENPCLYTVLCTPHWKNIKGATIRFKRGFAQMFSHKDTLLLNGTPVFLRGLARHDVVNERGPCLTGEERLQDFLDMKKLGANCLRIAHFPQDRHVYELCDSLGLLVIDEIPCWKTNAAFLCSKQGIDRGTAYLRETIKYHGNYTSIALWNIANEIASYTDEGAKYVRAVAHAAHVLDPSRSVTYASYYYQFDKAYDAVDVISVNEYFGWYLGSVANGRKNP